MQVRPLDTAETDALRAVARASLQESYGALLGGDTIGRAIEEWYADDVLERAIEAEDALLLVASDAGDVVGFAETQVSPPVDTARVQWIHVHPDERGRGVGTALFDRTRADLDDRGVDRLTGLVLAVHEAGRQFYEDRGLEELYDRTVTIGGEQYTETVYGDPAEAGDALEPWEVPGAGQVVVDFDDGSRGAAGTFYPVYRDRDREHRYGWFCAACEAVDNAMDPMGRIECNGCGNRRTATRWDAGYL